MPEVQEVFRMATQKVRPESGFVDRQIETQRRKQRNRRIGAYVVAGTITAAALALVLVTLPGDEEDLIEPDPTAQAQAEAVEVSTNFVDAFGAFDGATAITYLADDAVLDMDANTPEEVPLFTTFLEAQGYEQIVEEDCAVTGGSDTTISVTCPFEWHAIRSGELGLGPYPGEWTFAVRDGELAAVGLHWDYLESFSPEVWEPFRSWVYTNHRQAFDVMYIPDGTNFRLTEESARLWEKYTREYVEEQTG
jgi:hypothetical protein